MTFLKLSEIPLHKDVSDVIDHLIDHGYTGITNDLSGTNVEYELDDLMQVWENIHETLK